MTLEQWIEAKGYTELFAKFKLAAKHQGILDPNDRYTLARACMIALRYELEKSPTKEE